MSDERTETAIAIPVEERNRIVEMFFTEYGGGGGGRFGLGRAVLDFQTWEIASGRVADSGGSVWWKGMNGLMVLDLAEAGASGAARLRSVVGWENYSSGATATQAGFWDAHQRSLHAAVRLLSAELEEEPAAEREFADIVVDVVDRTALVGSPTDTADLAGLTERYYPDYYPIDREALPRLVRMRERTADRMRNERGAIFSDVGMNSTRWD